MPPRLVSESESRRRTVEHEVVRLFTVAIRKKLCAGSHVIRPGSASDGAGRGVTHADDSWTENRELREVPAVQGEIADSFGLDHLSYRRGVRFEQRRRGLYLDC